MYTNGIKFIIVWNNTIPVSQQSDGINHKDALDAIISACQKDVDIIDDDTGKPRKERVLDNVSMWWKTHIINQPGFGRYAKILTNLENKATDAPNHMTMERAQVCMQQIMLEALSHKHSIDAKSSESRYDKNNKQQTLMHMLNAAKSERVVTLNEEAKRSLFESIFGGEKKKAAES